RSTPERPSGVRLARRKAVRRASACQGRLMLRRISPGRRSLLSGPFTKSTTGTLRSEPSGDQMVQTPSSAAVSEIIGPAGSDMQRLPPTVAMFQILKEARNERQHVPISRAAGQETGGSKASSVATL